MSRPESILVTFEDGAAACRFIDTVNAMNGKGITLRVMTGETAEADLLAACEEALTELLAWQEQIERMDEQLGAKPGHEPRTCPAVRRLTAAIKKVRTP